MASAPSHHLLILFLSFALLNLSASADNHQDFHLHAVNNPPVLQAPAKPSAPPPATVHPPTPPLKPYTPPPVTSPSSPPVKPFTPPPVTSPVKPYPPSPPKAAVPPVASPDTPPPKAPAPHIATPPAPYRPPVIKKDCVPLCEARCAVHSRKRVCVRACSTCCERCKCVPPGTSGNREVCGTCWTDMRTHGNRFKCP